MKIYIAGRFDDKQRLKQSALYLESIGHTVVSSWLDENVKPEAIPTESFMRGIAIVDALEVNKADCFILDTQYGVGERGGRENEFGAIMLDPYVLKVVVGPLRTVFHRLFDVHFNTWEQLMDNFPGVADNTQECLEKCNFGKESK